MIRNLIAVIVTAILLPAVGRSAVISRDWKTPGDGLLTYDDVNRREWLDLSQTLLSDQFPGADPSPFVTRENRFQYVVSQTQPGEMFAGFRVAMATDVIAFAQSAGIQTGRGGPHNGVAAAALVQLLGSTYEARNRPAVSVGLINETTSVQPGPPMRLAGVVDSELDEAGLYISQGHFQYPAPPGVMLYRGVPEPGSLALMLMCAVLMGGLR